MAEHCDTFTANGFKLAVDLTAPAGRRVQLLSVPFSKSVHFGVDDVNELASMISEHYGGGGGADDYATGASDSTSQRVSKSYLALKNDDVRLSQKGPGGSAANPMANATTGALLGVTQSGFPITAMDDHMQHNQQVAMGLAGANNGYNESSTASSSQHQQQIQQQFRLPKLVAMYASRACRSAIMIGTALKAQEMQRVVNKLEHVEQPWNCPHGRPTLRHLVDLSPIRQHSSHQNNLKVQKKPL